MLTRFRLYSFLILGLVFLLASAAVRGQSGNSGSIEGAVKDPSGAVIAGAAVEITNPVSGYTRTASTGADGTFRFGNVPFNPYHLTVTQQGFKSYTQDFDVRSSVPVVAQISLQLGAAATSVTVEANGGDLVENDSTFHTDVDRGLFDKLPLESQSSSLSSLVTLCHARGRRRFQRTVSGTRRSRVEFVLGRRAADHRSAKQSLLESDSGGCGAIDGSDSRARHPPNMATRPAW